MKEEVLGSQENGHTIQSILVKQKVLILQKGLCPVEQASTPTVDPVGFLFLMQRVLCLILSGPSLDLDSYRTG